ncbi:hypothetical protein POTOM_007297 [Populus tomentosa]|uniref:Uncharacterized protein n=1 Tax=Populus tomentosa TaxID=118781 RepID=A0A8X8ABZ2_POPTO|nr:hypothetical protein POTOM_007297 [Populus tomentosa]
METSFNSLVRLKRLAIQEKKTSGEFPDLGVLKGPNYLDACDNQISSQVPSTLPRSLLELSMRNNFHGNLPDNVSWYVLHLSRWESEVLNGLPSKLDTPWSLVVNVVMRNLRGESFIRRVCREDEDDDEKRYLKRRKIVLDLDSFGEGLRC